LPALPCYCHAKAQIIRQSKKNQTFYSFLPMTSMPEHEGGAQWFYSLPKHDNLCKPAEYLYRDYLGAVKYGNIFSIDVGPDYEGKIRQIDVKTLQQVGKYIRTGKQLPETE